MVVMLNSGTKEKKFLSAVYNEWDPYDSLKGRTVLNAP